MNEGKSRWANRRRSRPQWSRIHEWQLLSSDEAQETVRMALLVSLGCKQDMVRLQIDSSHHHVKCLSFYEVKGREVHPSLGLVFPHSHSTSHKFVSWSPFYPQESFAYPFVRHRWCSVDGTVCGSIQGHNHPPSSKWS